MNRIQPPPLPVSPSEYSSRRVEHQQFSLVPTGATTGNVTVTVGNVVSNGVRFTASIRYRTQLGAFLVMPFPILILPISVKHAL